jgi:hypothetical protein
MAQNEKVIISVELKDKGVKAGLDSAAKASEQAAQATRALSAAEKDETYWATEAGKAEAQRAVKTNIAKGKAKELALQTVSLTKATKQGKTQTGLNNAILTEAGRVASDAAYGMQGMANNIGQLATLMSQHAQTQGGFVASMRALKGSLFGVGGILIGIQLFISFLPQIEKWYKKLISSGNDFVKTLTNQQVVLSLLAKRLSDENTTLEDRKSLLNSLKKDNKELYDILVKDGKERDDSNTRLEKYLELLKQEEEIKKKSQQLEEENKEIEEDVAKYKKDIVFYNERIAENQRNLAKYTSESYKEDQYTQEDIRNAQENILYNKRLISKTEDDISEEQENQLKLGNRILDLNEKNAKIRKQIGLEKEPKKKKEESPDKFESRLLDLSELEKKYRRESEKNDEETARQKVARKEQEAKEDLEITKNSFVEKEKARLLDFQKGKALSEEQIRAIETQAQLETDIVVTQIEARTNAELDAINKKEEAQIQSFRKFRAQYEQQENANTERQKQINEERDNELEAERQARFYIGNVSQALAQKEADDVFFANRKAELERELSSVKLSNAKKLDLENQLSNLKKDKGQADVENEQAVQESKLALANRGAAAFVDIIGKETKAGKAVAATMATINTYQAVTNALKFGKTPFKYVDAAATAAQGFAQVKSILNTTSPATSGGGTGGGGVAQTVTPPDFNIIGTTGVNQLATAIGGTTQEPIKAYVVSSEITSAQELDRNIIDSASL